MYEKDAVRYLPLYDFNLMSQILIELTHLIDGYMTGIHPFRPFLCPEIDNVKYGRKNHLDWIEEQDNLRILKGRSSKYECMSENSKK